MTFIVLDAYLLKLLNPNACRFFGNVRRFTLAEYHRISVDIITVTPDSHIARWSAGGGRIPTTAAPNNTASNAAHGFLCIRACDEENAITGPGGGVADQPNGVADGDEFHDG